MPIVWARENLLVITCNLCFPVNRQTSVVEWELKELTGPCWWLCCWREKTSRWHISSCGRAIMTLYANDISCANRENGRKPIQQGDVSVHCFIHLALALYKSKSESAWPLTRLDFSVKHKVARHKSTCDRRTVEGVAQRRASSHPMKCMQASGCMIYSWTLHSLLRERRLLWGFTSLDGDDPLPTLSTALQLASDGSSWDVSRNPSNKWTRRYFPGQGRRSIFFLLIFFVKN